MHSGNVAGGEVGLPAGPRPGTSLELRAAHTGPLPYSVRKADMGPEPRSEPRSCPPTPEVRDKQVAHRDPTPLREGRRSTTVPPAVEELRPEEPSTAGASVGFKLPLQQDRPPQKWVGLAGPSAPAGLPWADVRPLPEPPVQVEALARYRAVEPLPDPEAACRDPTAAGSR